MAQIRRRGPNRYLITVYVGRDAQGKKVFENETFYGTLPEARQRAAELEAGKRKRGPRKLAMTVGEYLETWLERIKGTVSRRTHDTYAWHVRKALPAIGDLQLYGLTAFKLQDKLAGLSGKPKTLKGIYSTLKTAFKQAVAWGLVNTDPTSGLKSPRVPRREITVLTRADLHNLLEVAREYKHHLIIRLLAVTGARLGEVLGLNWRDIDLEKGTVTIRRAADLRYRQLKETKTASSQRILSLDLETIALLKDFKKAQGKGKVTALRKGDALVFTAPDGRPVREMAVRRTMARILKKAGLDHMRIHDLRHTAGSLLLDAGHSLALVAAFLGHSSTATTASIYAHAVRKNVGMGGVLVPVSDKVSDC